MKKHILLLRWSYWIAAIADFCIAFLVLMPERMGLPEMAYPMGLASAIAFSWGILLLIADRKPLERRWVLIPTIIVVTLLSIARITFAIHGVIDFSIAFLVFGIFLVVFMGYSYSHAKQFESME